MVGDSTPLNLETLHVEHVQLLVRELAKELTAKSSNDKVLAGSAISHIAQKRGGIQNTGLTTQEQIDVMRKLTKLNVRK